MTSSDTRQPPVDRATPTRFGRFDRLIYSLLFGSLGAFGGGAIAWAGQVDVSSVIAWGIVGYLATVALSWLLLPVAIQLAIQPNQAFRAATESLAAPKALGPAVRQAVQQQRDYLIARACFDALCGGALGALLARTGGSSLLGVVIGAVLGMAVLALLGLLARLASIGLSISLVRKYGVAGHAILGGLGGMVLGMVLWWRYWRVAWSPVGAVVVGVPMSLLLALAGWKRRPPGHK